MAKIYLLFVFILNLAPHILSDLLGLGQITNQLTGPNPLGPLLLQPTQSSVFTPPQTTTQKPQSFTSAPPFCHPSITTVRGKQTCKDDLIFEENFDILDTQIWKRDIRIPLDTEDAEFVSYQNYADNCYVKEGKLYIVPKLLTSFPGFDENRLRTGTLNLNPRCTGIFNPRQECIRTAGFQTILPPIVSCKLNTKASFVFKYGKIEIRAKFPKGDWIFPQLYLEPFEHAYGFNDFASGQMRIGFINGNEMLTSQQNEQIDGYRLYGGLVLSQNQGLKEVLMRSTLSDTHFADNFHNYTLTWTKERISVAVDGIIYGNYRAGAFQVQARDKNIAHASIWNEGEEMAPFDKEFYLSLGVAVGGISNFPDFSKNGNSFVMKPWNNTSPKAEVNFWIDKDNWHSTWRSHNATMQIDYVKVWAI